MVIRSLSAWIQIWSLFVWYQKFILFNNDFLNFWFYQTCRSARTSNTCWPWLIEKTFVLLNVCETSFPIPIRTRFFSWEISKIAKFSSILCGFRVLFIKSMYSGRYCSDSWKSSIKEGSHLCFQTLSEFRVRKNFDEKYRQQIARGSPLNISKFYWSNFFRTHIRKYDHHWKIFV